MRILHGADQESLGRISLKRNSGRGLLLQIWALYCDGGPLPQGIRGVKGGTGLFYVGESGRLEGLRGHLGWGGASTPADHIRGPAEVLLAGVGLRAMCYPGHRDRLSSGRG